MTRPKSPPAITVAICADENKQQRRLKAVVRRRGWNDSGLAYRLEQWRALIADAKARRFNAVCGAVDGVRWFAQLSIEPSAKPRVHDAVQHVPDQVAPDPVILERARALTASLSPSAEIIAQSLVLDGLLKGTASATAKRVRASLIASNEFCAMKVADGLPLIWRRWSPPRRTVRRPDGGRTLYTEVLSTTGIPVGITIPLRPDAEIVEFLARELVEEYRRDKP